MSLQQEPFYVCVFKEKRQTHKFVIGCYVAQHKLLIRMELPATYILTFSPLPPHKEKSKQESSQIKVISLLNPHTIELIREHKSYLNRNTRRKMSLSASEVARKVSEFWWIKL